MNAVTSAIAAEAVQAPYMEFADLLLSGLSGRQLHAELWARFPTISRFDVFLALQIASTILEYDLAHAEAEATVAKARCNG